MWKRHLEKLQNRGGWVGGGGLEVQRCCVESRGKDRRGDRMLIIYSLLLQTRIYN